MIDPSTLQPTLFEDDRKLEEFFVFCVLVAGKTAKVVARQLEAIRKNAKGNLFDYLGSIPDLGSRLRDYGVGCWSMKAQALKGAIRRVTEGTLNLRTCSPEELESIMGIGPKTSRFFIVYSRPEAEYAILDTHILKWLRYQGYNAPKGTPSGKQYARWEKIFLEEMKAVAPGVKVQDFDLAIWNEFSRKVS